MQAQKKFAVGSGLIIVTLAALAYAGFTQSKTYYHTITELPSLQGPAAHQRLRVSGNVANGSIVQHEGRTDFVLEEQNKKLNVSYSGRDPLPDTFKDGAQALVEGRLMPDGSFDAEQIQAKCASKYQATPQQAAPDMKNPAHTESTQPSGAVNSKS